MNAMAKDAFGLNFFALSPFGCPRSQNYTSSTRKYFLGVFRDEANDFIVLRAIAHEALGPLETTEQARLANLPAHALANFARTERFYRSQKTRSHKLGNYR